MLKCKIFDSIADSTKYQEGIEASREKLERNINDLLSLNQKIEVIAMNSVALKVSRPHGMFDPGIRTIIVYRNL